MYFATDAQLTNHARLRMQQRAISAEALALVLEHGEEHYDHHGGRIVFLPREKRRRLLAVLLPTTRRRLEKQLDAYLVCRATGPEVFTVGHRSQRIRRH